MERGIRRHEDAKIAADAEAAKGLRVDCADGIVRTFKPNLPATYRMYRDRLASTNLEYADPSNPEQGWKMSDGVPIPEDTP